MIDDSNTNAIEAWNTVLFDKFCTFRHILTTGLRTHGDEALRRRPPAKGARVLDIGCGFGDTTVELARIVGPQGEAVGLDAAPRFIEAATLEARESGLKNVRFVVGDPQDSVPEGPFDAAFSRFGTMFFASPVAALRNIGRALATDAILTMVVWRKREDNSFIHDAEQVVKPLLPEPDHALGPTCGPGPFSMASADVVSDVLLKAGFRDVGFFRNEAAICIGRDLDEAVRFAMNLGPAGELVRLAGDEGVKRRPQVEAALRDVLARYIRPNGIIAPSSSWIVTAHWPGSDRPTINNSM